MQRLWCGGREEEEANEVGVGNMALPKKIRAQKHTHLAFPFVETSILVSRKWDCVVVVYGLV